MKCHQVLNTVSFEKRDSFILHANYGFWQKHPDVIYYRLKFNKHSYSPDLFAKYKITMPENIIHAVHTRQAEYLAGRICCQQLLKQKGVDGEVATNTEDRSPVWPKGIHGSISHSKDYAIAVICLNGFPGVDIELLDCRILLEAQELITSEHERAMLSRFKDEGYSMAKLLLLAFSAKESLFKALYPQLKYYFGFEYVTLNWIGSNDYELILKQNLEPKFRAGTVWTGSFQFEHLLDQEEPTDKEEHEDGLWLIITIVVDSCRSHIPLNSCTST